MDFFLVGLLPVVAPDMTSTMSNDALRDMIEDPARVLYNVFIKNVKIHLPPNFDIKEVPVLECDELIVVNKFKMHQSFRLIDNGKKSPVKINNSPGEELSIKLVKPIIRAYDKKYNMFKMDSIDVVMNKFGMRAQWELLFNNPGLMYEVFDMNNKIDVLLKSPKINFRRDDFYALNTFMMSN